MCITCVYVWTCRVQVGSTGVLSSLLRSQGKSAASYKLVPVPPGSVLASGTVDGSLNCGMAWVSDKTLRLKREDGVTVNVSI